jgi:MFS transporter, SP family, solute carrier family 2 (myo-inositol transporter), member 13
VDRIENRKVSRFQLNILSILTRNNHCKLILRWDSTPMRVKNRSREFERERGTLTGNTTPAEATAPRAMAAIQRYNAFLLLVAGLGGLLYGIDVGIIGGAYPYLAETSRLTPAQLSSIVAAVLGGSVLSTLFAGLLADWMGRKPLMVLSGLTFALSIPIIALSQGYWPLFCGRLMQGMSAGLVGVVVPLYLAECLAAAHRGKGTAIFQWLLTLGIVAAALVGMYFSYRVDAVAKMSNASALLHFKDRAWRSIFWVSLPPGLIFVLGSLMVTESPRWLFRRGEKERAHAALLRSRNVEQAKLELDEMSVAAHAAGATKGQQIRDSLLRRKYVIPFLLACVILACNTATGVNSVIGYNAGILMQSGLSDLASHWGYVIFTVVNFLATTIGLTLVDRKGRRFLMVIGTAGIIVAMVSVGVLFRTTEKIGVDCRDAVQAMVSPEQNLTLRFDAAGAGKLLANTSAPGNGINSSRASLAVIFSYGGFTGVTNFVRSDDAAALPIEITRSGSLPGTRIEAFFKNPFADLTTAETAPLKIEKALLGSIPNARHGWMVALGLYFFMAFYALGPGVVVWLALSELMPTRIRSNGMSIALLLNQLVSTTLAAIFLPFVSKHGYSSMFFLFAGFTVVYFLVAALFLPETKGKTLEEIEAHFDKTAARS